MSEKHSNAHRSSLTLSHKYLIIYSHRHLHVVLFILYYTPVIVFFHTPKLFPSNHMAPWAAARRRLEKIGGKLRKKKQKKKIYAVFGFSSFRWYMNAPSIFGLTSYSVTWWFAPVVKLLFKLYYLM